MRKDELFVGRKVWIKPNPLYKEDYPNGYVETVVTNIGTKLFQVKDDIRPRTKYRIKGLEEATVYHRKGYILLDIEGQEDFDRKEQLIIKVRKHFNSRLVYNESEETIQKVISLLGL